MDLQRGFSSYQEICKLGQTGEEGELYFDFLVIDLIGMVFECFRSREDCISGLRSRRGVELMGVGCWR